MCCYIAFRIASVTLLSSRKVLLSRAQRLLSRRVSAECLLARYRSVLVRLVPIANTAQGMLEEIHGRCRQRKMRIVMAAHAADAVPLMFLVGTGYPGYSVAMFVGCVLP